MKIALVNVSDGAEAYGLVILASYLRKYSDYSDITIVNINEFEGYINQTNVSTEDYIKRLIEIGPDVVGLSAMTIFYGRAVDIAKMIRKNESLSKCKIIIGGVHISTLPTSLKRVFDYGVIGEGEETFHELLGYIDKNKTENYDELKDINGVVYFGMQGNLQINGKRPLIEPLDRLGHAHPDYSKLNLMHSFLKGKKIITTTIMTSRGCPYNCIFCSTTIFWANKIRFFSAEHVVDDIEMWHNKYGVTHIAICDDLFTINKGRLRRIIEMLEERNLLGKLSYECMARSNTIDEEVMVLLKKLNVKELNFGFESGSPKVLSILKKNSVAVNQHKKAIELGQKYNIKVSGSIIFGSPGEKLEDMKQTLNFIDFCIKHNVHHIWSFVMTPFPGTEIWEIAKKRGKVSDDMDWNKLSHFNLDDPLLLDQDVPLEEFKKIWIKNKKKQRHFIIKVWLQNLRNAPFHTITDLFKSLRFIKFFTNDFS